ncbi:sulfite exporter TauE/SafE family protein [Streptomyces sp. NPDC048385]|uniref:sulfite exporter TauE/SafE family protein n=1 Tax=unclassified Streptomyces TaxID=2593676 RepID=UPI0034349B52
MLYLAIAVLVFVLSGVLAMAGLGAAFLFVPLFYWLGVPLPVAASTALLLNAVSLSFASVTYWRAGLVDLRLGVPITVTAVAAAPLGARLAPHVNTTVLLGLFAAFLLFAGAMMMFYRRPATPRALTWRAEVGTGTGVGTLAGFLGGLLGVGGGNFILPVLNGLGMSAKVAAGTTGLAVVFSSLSGFLGRVSTGGLDPVLVGVSVLAAAGGSLAGSRLMTSRISDARLKHLIAVLLWVIAVKIVLDLVTG